MAIDPDVEERIDTIEVEIHTVPLPVLGDGEASAVRSDFITVTIGRPLLGRGAHDTATPVVGFHLMPEDDLLIHVDRRAILLPTILLKAVDIPIHRHRDLVPTADIVAWLEEVTRTLVGRSHPVEGPRSIKVLVKRTILGKDLRDLIPLLRAKGEEECMWLLFVERMPGGALPFIALGICLVLILVARQDSLGAKATRERKCKYRE